MAISTRIRNTVVNQNHLGNVKSQLCRRQFWKTQYENVLFIINLRHRYLTEDHSKMLFIIFFFVFCRVRESVAEIRNTPQWVSEQSW